MYQGNESVVNDTNAIEFTSLNNALNDKNFMHAPIVCNFRPLKYENFRFHITVGGDLRPYHLDARSPAADLLETKLILNSVISDSSKGARFMSLDIKDHFLATPMKDPEHTRVKCKRIPDDVRKSQHRSTCNK